MFRDTQSSGSAFFLQKAAGFAAATAVRGEKEKMKTINQDWKEWEENPGEIMGESKVPPLSGGEHPPPLLSFSIPPQYTGSEKAGKRALGIMPPPHPIVDDSAFCPINI